MKEYITVSRSATGRMTVKVSIVDGSRAANWAMGTARGQIKADKKQARAYALAMLEELGDDDE